MQIVIDIPDNYDLSKIQNGSIASKIILNAVANGTPLPKGHGRISDMDAAIKCIEEVEGEDAIYAIGLIEWACGKRTIVEADRSDSEE